MTTTVLLVEDHRLIREALRAALDFVPDVRIVGEAGDAATALVRADELAPDVIVMDIGLPDLNGIELAARLRDRGCRSRIVALSAHTDKRFVTEMLRAGAAAYVTKSSAGTELVRAIRAIAAGQSYICPEVSGALVDELRGGGAADEPPRLGRREREVLRLIAEGQRSAAIAEQLHISNATVEVHRRNIMRKLNLHTVAELTRYAVREGMVSP